MTDLSTEIGNALMPLLDGKAPPEQQYIIAQAERTAAAVYRKWAADEADESVRGQLIEAAEREETTANLLESMLDDLAGLQARLGEDARNMGDMFAAYFEVRPLVDQYTLLQGAESAAGPLMDSFGDADPDNAETLSTCAANERANADFLASLIETRK